MKKSKKLFYLILLTLTFSNLEAGKKKFAFSYREATRKEQKQFSREIKKHLRKMDKKIKILPKEIHILENLQLKGFGRIFLPKLNFNKKQTLTILILFMLLFTQVSADINYVKQGNKWPDKVKLTKQKELDQIKGYKFCNTVTLGYKKKLDICTVITNDYNVKICATEPLRCIDVNFKNGIDGGLKSEIDKYRGFAPDLDYRVAQEVSDLVHGRSDFGNKTLCMKIDDQPLSLYEINKDDTPVLYKEIEEIKKFVNLNETGSKYEKSFWLARRADDKPWVGSDALVQTECYLDKCYNDIVFSIESLYFANNNYYFTHMAGHEIAHLLQSCCGGQDQIDDNNEMISDIIADMFLLLYKRSDIVSGLVTTPNYDTFFKQIEPNFEVFLDDPYAYSDELRQCGYNHPDYVTRAIVRLIIRSQSVKAIKLLLETQQKYLKFYKFEEEYEDSYVEKIKDEL
ncbi:MAG: hypothetical protein SZ59_C0001G0186 [candidate division TM6 bacterium GW2011_GWF2_28_16]|nr:MAG: hypothetical protein SZ59_C0001G0186 [candidate division TM6 bacterium GW2011_GWF2_28_16]